MRDREPASPGDAQKTFDLLCGVSHWFSLPAHAILHRAGTAGVWYFRGHAMVSVVVALLFIELCPDRRNVGVAYAALAFAAARMLQHNTLARRAEAAGEQTHPRYVGDSLLTGLGLDNEKSKKDWEPLLTLSLVGLGLAVCPALGLYMVVAAFAMSFGYTVWERRLKTQVRAARAARIDQQTLAAHMRRA